MNNEVQHWKHDMQMVNSEKQIADSAQKEHIALVIDYSLEYLGGAQSAFLDAAYAFLQAGHKVTIVSPLKVASLAREWAQNWPGAIIGIKPKVMLPGVDLPLVLNTQKLRKKLYRLLIKKGVTALHVHSEFGLAQAAIKAAQEAKIVTCHTVHTFFWQARAPKIIDILAAKPLKYALQKITGCAPENRDRTGMPLTASRIDSVLRGATLAQAKNSDIVISPSAHQARKLMQAAELNMLIAPNPACAPMPNSQQEQRTDLPPLDKQLQIVWIGRAVPEKRLLEFIQAIKIAAAANTKLQIKATVIGEGPLLESARAAAVGMPVEFTGRLSRSAVTQQLQKNHLLALTSYGFDNQPVVIVESVRAGRPVLVCDSNLEEGLKGGSGIYTAGPAAEQLAEKIIEIANNPEILLEAAKHTAEDAKVFDPEHYADTVVKAYRENRRSQK